MKKNFPPSDFEQAICGVSAFFAVCGRPLRIEDVRRYMVFPGSEKKNLSDEEIGDFFNGNLKFGQLNGCFFPTGQEYLASNFENKEQVTNRYWKKVFKFGPLLQMVPFIRAIAVCNTLSFNNCNENSDIDLFIIVKKGRIFTARIFSVLLTYLLGVRRHGDKVAGRFCLSFYVADDGMNLEKMVLNNDAYLYYWMRALRFIYCRNGFDQSDFFESNKWFKDSYVDYSESAKKDDFLSFLRFFPEFILGGFIGNWLENRLGKMHFSRFRKNRKSFGTQADVVVSKSMLKFHNIDRRRQYNEDFFRLYEALL